MDKREIIMPKKMKKSSFYKELFISFAAVLLIFLTVLSVWQNILQNKKETLLKRSENIKNSDLILDSKSDIAIQFVDTCKNLYVNYIILNSDSK